MSPKANPILPASHMVLSTIRLLLIILSALFFHNYYFPMRLLLMQPHKPALPPTDKHLRSLSDCILPTFQNILSKKCTLLQTKSPHQQKIIFSASFQTSVPPYSFRITLEMTPGQQLAVYRAVLLRSGTAMLAGGELRVNLMHKISRKTLSIDNHTVEIDPVGQIHFVSRITYSNLLLSSHSQLTREADARLKGLIRAAQSLLVSVLVEINAPSKQGEELLSGKTLHLEKVKRHIFFSCYDLGLSQKASGYRHPTEETLLQREKIIKSLLGAGNTGEGFFLGEGKLFGLHEEPDVGNSKEWRRQFQSTYYFEKLLQVPVPKTANAAENAFVFNQIKIERPEQVVAQEMPVGGGCLKVMAVSAAYVTSGAKTDAKGGDARAPVFLQKALVAKIPRGQSSRQRGKVQHERNIVRLFSSAHSGYLLKYYICNQPTFALRHALLMDYHLGTVTLLDHLQLRRESLSLQGKLTLLAHLSNGLRFLAYYKVVHMDLTLSNILVYDGYLPKIIDFGEAYHRETIQTTAKSAYAPGFTLPYCAPEVFRNKEFSSAQDMFSFGVIIFRLLLNALPIFPADSLLDVYRNGGHHKLFFLAPERLAAVCQQRVCFLLLQLINLCLRAQEDGRPLPIWTTIVLKEILTEVFL